MPMHSIAARLAEPLTTDHGPEDVVVLIVTADADLRAAAARVVMREGYRAVTASHAGHALLACLRERIDIVATDLSMDEMSGPALAARVRRHSPQVATVYFANPGTHECEGLLVRPFTSDDLMAALASARATVIYAPTSWAV